MEGIRVGELGVIVIVMDRGLGDLVFATSGWHKNGKGHP